MSDVSNTSSVASWFAEDSGKAFPAGRVPSLMRVGLWILHRNPLYLLSAATMACGARLLLVQPNTQAGDLANILLTLVVLQVYEIAVTAVLFTLHAFRKSPEDLPSLLLVASVFWTGPLAATSELIARNHDAGIGLSLALACLAGGEFEFVRRRLQLPISNWSRAAAAGTLALIALWPTFLVSRSIDGRGQESTLLAGWWILAVLLLPVARAASAWGRPVGHADRSGAGIPAESIVRTNRSGLVDKWAIEPIFCFLLIAAACAHLVAMSHAFFLHASAAHAAPAIVLLTIVAIEVGRLAPRFPPEWDIVFLGLPLLGVWIASGGFDEKLVEPLLPVGLRQPVYAVGLLAGLTWWYAAWRGHGALFLHLGSAAVAIAGAHFVDVMAQSLTQGAGQGASAPAMALSIKAAWCAIAGVVYFSISAVVRGSRWDCAAAMCMLAVASILPTWRSVPLDRVIVGTVIFWWWLAILLVLSSRPTTGQFVWVVVYGVLMTIALDFHEPSRIVARLHAPLIPAAFVLLSYCLGRKDSGVLAAASFVVLAGFLITREVSRQEVSNSVLVVAGSFSLLALAAAVSWHKTELVSGISQEQSTGGEGVSRRCD